MELLGEELEPGIAGEMDEPGGFGRLADFEAVAVLEPALGAAVDGEEELFALVGDAEGDEAVVRQDHGAVAEGVGADGFEHDGGGFAVQDGAAGGKGVAGAADGVFLVEDRRQFCRVLAGHEPHQVLNHIVDVQRDQHAATDRVGVE